MDDGAPEGMDEGAPDGMDDGTSELVSDDMDDGIVDAIPTKLVETSDVGRNELKSDGTSDGTYEKIDDSASDGTLDIIVDGTSDTIIDGISDRIVEGTLDKIVDGESLGASSNSTSMVITLSSPNTLINVSLNAVITICNTIVQTSFSSKLSRNVPITFSAKSTISSGVMLVFGLELGERLG